MRILDIMAMPEVVNDTHESVYRSYHILQKTKEWLQAYVPGHVILELISDMEEAPEVNEHPRLHLDRWERGPAQ